MTSAELDWSWIATALADRATSPLLLIDTTGSVRIMNTAFESLLAVDRSTVVGRLFTDTCVAPSSREQTERHLTEAFRGARPTFEVELAAPNGLNAVGMIDTALVGGHPADALCLTVRNVRRRASLPIADVEYEVSLAEPFFGALRRVSGFGFAVQAEMGCCYQVLRQRATPCPDCPLLRDGAEPWPRTTVRSRSDETPGYEVLTAEALPGGYARISRRSIGPETFGALLDNKVNDLGRRASLSDRELTVLRALVTGGHPDEIATHLDISPRTVKYHQTKLLEKLGADSRHDLLRLIF